MFWIYNIPHSFEKSLWFEKSLLISDLRVQRSGRWLPEPKQGTTLFENTCAMHFAFCPKVCGESVQRPLRAAL